MLSARRADPTAAEGLAFAFAFALPQLALGFGLASHSPHKSPIIEAWKRFDDSPLLTYPFLPQALGSERYLCASGTAIAYCTLMCAQPLAPLMYVSKVFDHLRKLHI